ncbi:hypothetical protein AT55_02027 [Streptococcus equi subsp. zooepidemicus Sz4is]|uniref:Uncharacterized protein n=1 Tax=Streptococcus equi subsp. zooepidemicus Sz4is TaxID=1381082 RepID=A0AAW3GJ25_STRSZ|nr:hypothetical protein AT55_02027 [Streptococcus equi subsp. zooepidemicus Sz4is]
MILSSVIPIINAKKYPIKYSCGSVIFILMSHDKKTEFLDNAKELVSSFVTRNEDVSNVNLSSEKLAIFTLSIKFENFCIITSIGKLR